MVMKGVKVFIGSFIITINDQDVKERISVQMKLFIQNANLENEKFL